MSGCSGSSPPVSTEPRAGARTLSPARDGRAYLPPLVVTEVMSVADAVEGALRGYAARIDGVNRRTEEAVLPEIPDPFDAYEDLLRSIPSTRALHFGSGRDKHGFAEALSGEVVAVDADASDLSRNAILARVVGDGHRLPFADDALDLVFSEFVFEHLPDPAAALREIDRVLAPAGTSSFWSRTRDTTTPGWPTARRFASTRSSTASRGNSPPRSTPSRRATAGVGTRRSSIRGSTGGDSGRSRAFPGRPATPG